MGDYEGIPSEWDWSAAIAESTLRGKLKTSKSRLISIHRPDGGAAPKFTAIWVANTGADETKWNWNPGATGDQLDGLVKKDKGRLIHIDAFNVTGKRVLIAGIWVQNTGAFEKEWDWNPELTEQSLIRVLAHRWRIISLTTYVKNGQRRYAAVWVRNTGAEQRDWDWTANGTFEQVRQSLEDMKGRLNSLDSFTSNGETHFAAAWVDNTDALAKGWWWNVGEDAAEIKVDIPLFCSYMVEARTLPGDAAHFGHFRHGFPRSAYKESAALVEITGTASVSDVVSDANGYYQENASIDLHVKNISGGAVDITEADLIRTYNGWFWPDISWRLQPMFDAGQILAANSTHMVAGADYHGTWNDSEWGLTHYVARVRATGAGGAVQRTALSIPMPRAGYPAPDPTTADVPVFMGLWSNPLDIVTLITNGKLVRWLVLGGSITNWTGQTVHVAGLHATVLTPGGTIVADRELNHDFRQLQYPDWPPEPTSPTSHGELKDPYVVFVDGMEISDRIDLARGLKVRLTLDYKINGWCGSTTREVDATFLQTPKMSAPVKGTWNFGNGMTQVGFSPHAHFHERYSYDLTQIIDGSTFDGPADDNTSFHCYGKEIHAMADGVVLGAIFTNPENNGKIKIANPIQNEVLLGHDGGPAYPRRSRYVHVQPRAPKSPVDPSRDLKVGDAVSAGDVIGFVGNAGNTSEPRLHFDLWGIDLNGLPRPWPVRFSNLRPQDGKKPMVGTPTTGEYDTT